VAAAAGETGKRAGVGDARLTRGAKWQRLLAGLAGCWLGREAEQAEPARPSSSPFLFLFYFPSSLFEFNFDF